MLPRSRSRSRSRPKMSRLRIPGFEGHFSRSLGKSDIKSCMTALNPEIFYFTFFNLVTWDDLDIYYGHRAQEIILTNFSDTIHTDSLPLFELNIEIVLADVTKPEKSNIWPDLWRHWWLRVHYFFLSTVFFQGFQMQIEFLELVQ